MPSYMYILECADGSYYTGSTKDLVRRLWQHQNGEGANHTKKRLPVKLVYAEPFDRVEEAFRREKQVQGWSRRKKKALIEGNYDKLIEFSRNHTQHGPFLEPAEGKPMPELVERNMATQDPATASTGSASACVVDGERPAQPANEPMPELVERNVTTQDPATASTGSASAYVVDGERPAQPANEPMPELVEGRGGAVDRGKPPECTDSRKFGEVGDC